MQTHDIHLVYFVGFFLGGGRDGEWVVHKKNSLVVILLLLILGHDLVFLHAAQLL